MTSNDFVQILIYVGALVALTFPLGFYIAKVFQEEQVPGLGFLNKFEQLIYRICHINADSEMSWKQYALNLLYFNFAGFVAVFIMHLVQSVLPLNPQNLSATSWHLAFNTAISFMTNTNWQAYSGENTLSYFTQMIGLGVQNFLSAATGIAVLVALVRGLTRRSQSGIGNFWKDVTKSTVHILLPLSLIFAIFLVGQGVPQNFKSYTEVKTLEGQPQQIPQGPAASQIAIKQLGTNGGGFFNTNSSHPFENPTPLSNFFEMLALLLLSSAIVWAFGLMIGKKKHALVILGVMFFIWLAGLAVSVTTEFHVNPSLGGQVVFEGKETRFGTINSLLWATATTAASNGSVNSMHSSLMPLSGGVALFNILLGEIVFGGVGSGLYGMLLFVLLTVFLAGLMVGRTPEYLGKRIEKRDIQLVILGILIPNCVILLGAGLGAILPAALSSIANKGPHGLTEILYAFASATGNNGSAFAGLNANTPFYNVALGFCMLFGRFGVIIPVLALAGLMSQKKAVPETSGTFRTDGATFAVLLTSVVFIVGALTFFPVLCLGPIVEHFLMLSGVAF